MCADCLRNLGFRTYSFTERRQDAHREIRPLCEKCYMERVAKRNAEKGQTK